MQRPTDSGVTWRARKASTKRSGGQGASGSSFFRAVKKKRAVLSNYQIENLNFGENSLQVR